MMSRFADPDRAVWYLCLGFRERHLSEPVEVFWQPKGQRHPRSMLVNVRDMEGPLKNACRHFSQATVVFEEGLLDYPFGAIQCRCTPQIHEICPYHCTHHDDRPIVCAALAPDGMPLSYAEKARIVETFLQVMQHDRDVHKTILKEKSKDD